jgi:formamidopyrimidine-DNA glycosylase
MPELPEVETLRRQLEKAIVAKTINKVEVLRAKSFKGDPKAFIGKKIEKIERVAKILIIKIFNFQFSIFNYLLIHLKLTGQLIYQDKDKRVFGGHPTPDWVGKLPSKHTRVVIDFTDGSKLFFNDMRVFGWLKVVESEKELEKELVGFKGLEPLTKEFTEENFAKKLQRTSRPIKLALMDQALIAGVGNIYCNDALWEAKISPIKPAKKLGSSEIKKLKESLEKVLNLGIKYGGASENTYRQLSGFGGKYQEHFLVYQRQGKPCLRCKTPIKKIQLGGRGTYFCPKCQK